MSLDLDKVAHRHDRQRWQWVADWYRSDHFSRQHGAAVIDAPTRPADSWDPHDNSAPPAAARKRSAARLLRKPFSSHELVKAIGVALAGHDETT